MPSVWERPMDAERMRAMLLKLPHVVKTVAWSTYVLFWAADKSIGGQLFAMSKRSTKTVLTRSLAWGAAHGATSGSCLRTESLRPASRG